MASFRLPLALLLILSVIAFTADPLSAIIGPLEYTGSLGYTYVEGENPIIKVVFQFDDEIGRQLLVTYASPQWSWTQGGNTLTLTGGSLQPGDALSIQVSFRQFVPPGEKPFQATGTTSAGEETTAYGVLVVSLMILLQVLLFLSVNRYIILGVTLVIGIIELWLSRRGPGTVIAAALQPVDCTELIEKCEKAKVEAEAAEAKQGRQYSRPWRDYETALENQPGLREFSYRKKKARHSRSCCPSKSFFVPFLSPSGTRDARNRQSRKRVLSRQYRRSSYARYRDRNGA